jgi:hypothetical protein
VVFAGGEGWLLLMQPVSIDAATSKLASTFIIASLNISTSRLTRLISSRLPFCAPVGGCGSGGTRVRLSSHVLHWGDGVNSRSSASKSFRSGMSGRRLG